jgi:hypothetical protein
MHELLKNLAIAINVELKLEGDAHLLPLMVMMMQYARKKYSSTVLADVESQEAFSNSSHPGSRIMISFTL